MSSEPEMPNGQLTAEEARAIVFTKGQRVRVSPYGAYCGMRRHSVITGTVQGWSRDGLCVRVVFDGTVTGQTYHKSFIEADVGATPGVAS